MTGVNACSQHRSNFKYDEDIGEKNEALSQAFELVKIGALPLVTLVVSFYFPNSAAR